MVSPASRGSAIDVAPATACATLATAGSALSWILINS